MLKDEIRWRLDDGPLDTWPNCATPDCPNKCCVWGLDPAYCYPCNVWMFGEGPTEQRYGEAHSSQEES